MTEATVPADLVEVARKAVGDSEWIEADAGIRAALAAVLPLHEQQVRDAVASELDRQAHQAAVAHVDGPECVEARTWTKAAEIARGPR